jgi:hypothetical protein
LNSTKSIANFKKNAHFVFSSFERVPLQAMELSKRITRASSSRAKRLSGSLFFSFNCFSSSFFFLIGIVSIFHPFRPQQLQIGCGPFETRFGSFCFAFSMTFFHFFLPFVLAFTASESSGRKVC